MNRGRRRLIGGAAAALSTPWLGTNLSLAEDVPAAVELPLTAAPLLGDATRLSYDGTPRGPVLRLKKGTPLALRLTNRLDVATSLQWFGLRGIGGIDRPLDRAQAIPPGGTLTQRFTPPDSGLFIFHPATLPGLPDQVAAGLRGTLILEEIEAPPVDADLLLVIGEAEAGALSVNAAAVPAIESIITGGRIRLRLVGGSTTRILSVGFEGASPKVIAIDGQPSDLFAPFRNAVPVGPGARFDVLADLPASEGAVLRVIARPLGPDGPGVAVTLAEITAKGPPREALPPIAALPPNPALPAAIPLERSARATMIIETVPKAAAGAAQWQLNGTAALTLPPSPLLRVKRGGAVTLGFDNRAQAAVPLHVHGQAMRLLHPMDDGWEPYWRDSVILPPASTTHVAFIADTPGRWLIESGFFAQASAGLRHWIEVI